MNLIRVEPLEPQKGRLCQVNEYDGHPGPEDETAIVIGQFPLAGGIVELRLCARCWRRALEEQQGGAGWMYMPTPCPCCVDNECECQTGEEEKQEKTIHMVAEY